MWYGIAHLKLLRKQVFVFKVGLFVCLWLNTLGYLSSVSQTELPRLDIIDMLNLTLTFIYGHLLAFLDIILAFKTAQNFD